MKKFTLLLIVLVGFSFTISAQDSPKHEIGIRLLNVRDFSLIYKKHLSENKYLRLRSAFTRVTATEEFVNFGLGTNVGLEKRKSIFEKTEFIYGGEVGVFYSFNKFDSDTFNNFNISIGGVLGIQRVLSNHFNLGIELVPTFSVNTSTNTNPSYVFDASFSTAAVFITYEFGNKE